MKTLLSIAAAVAAFTAASGAFAHDAPATGTSGHYEWESRLSIGANKANFPTQTRVWVKDKPNLASSDCAMMHKAATSADCMAMPDHGASASHG